MSRLRLILASLVLATTASACSPGLAHAQTLDPAKISAVKPAPIDRAKLRSKLAERRALTIERFLAYRNARVYPMNELPGLGGLRHVWVDHAGNLCAAATLISLDWGKEPTIRVGAENVEIKMADATGAVADWILTSGMTRAEIVAIQVPAWNYEEQFRSEEIQRLYQIYVDVERQVKSLWDANLDLAVDQLMKRPELARELLGGRVAGPGKYAQPPVG